MSMQMLFAFFENEYGHLETHQAIVKTTMV